MHIHFCKACDNKCEFCIENIQRNCEDPKPDIKAMLNTFRTFGSMTDATITGGEPFLFLDELSEFVATLHNENKNLNIYINTALPICFTQEKHTKIIDSILQSIKCLNVSLNHYDEEKNFKILNASSRHSRKDIIQKLTKLYPDKIRISFNLVQGFIDSKEEIEKTLSVLSNLGVKHARIRELFCTDTNYVSYEQICRIKLPSAYAFGCRTSYYDEVNKMNVSIKRSCFQIQTKCYASINDLIKIIFQPKNKSKGKYLSLVENSTIHTN